MGGLLPELFAAQIDRRIGHNFTVAIHTALAGEPHRLLIANPHEVKNSVLGVSFLDVSTGEFMVAQGSFDYVDKLIQSFRPSEILYPKKFKKFFGEQFGDRFYSYGLDEWIFAPDYANE